MNSGFFSCGLGDFIAIYSLMTKHEIESLENIFWATRARKTIEPLIPFCFPNIKSQISLYDQWHSLEDWQKDLQNNPYCVMSIQDMIQLAHIKKITLPLDFDKMKDYSLAPMTSDCRYGKRNYNVPLRLINNKLIDISDLNLPEDYFVIHTHSQNAEHAWRRVEEQEITHINYFLKKKKMKAILVDQTTEPKEFKSDNIINMTNKLSVLQVMELMKKAKGYIGTASSFSVWASKIINPENIYIKCTLARGGLDEKFYYFPASISKKKILYKNLVEILDYL